VSLDEAQSLANQLATTGEDPERAFDLELIRVLLAEVIEIVRRECQAANQTVHWEIFCLTMLSPIFDGSVAPPLSRLCQELRIPDTSQASNMNGTVKRRFQRVLRARIRQFVHSDDEIDEGIRTLFEILAAARQAGDADCVCTDDAARQRVEILTGTTGIDREPRDGEAE
jgi:hypothetical protein